ILNTAQKQQILASWPGAITWIMPKRPQVSYLLSGQYDSLAVRVSAHPVVQHLCHQFGKPLVSTSANLSGELPCKTVAEVQCQFGAHFPVVAGEVGNSLKPTPIRHSLTNQLIRE